MTFIEFIDFAYSPIENDKNLNISTIQRISNPNKTKKIKIFGKRVIKDDFNNNIKFLRIKNK